MRSRYFVALSLALLAPVLVAQQGEDATGEVVFTREAVAADHELALELVVTDRSDSDSDGDAALRTLDGDVVGTPAYMAPEQARGELSSLGPWTDVYALGATLYRCLSGRFPIALNSYMKTLQAIATSEAPRLRTLRPDAPQELDAIVAGAMAFDPCRRPDMERLAHAIEQLLARGVLMPPAPPADAV